MSDVVSSIVAAPENTGGRLLQNSTLSTRKRQCACGQDILDWIKQTLLSLRASFWDCALLQRLPWAELALAWITSNHRESRPQRPE